MKHSEFRPLPEGALASIDLRRVQFEDGGFLDRRERDGDAILLEGWALAYDGDKRVLPGSLLIVHDRTVIGTAEMGIGRDDLKDKLGLDTVPACGFRVMVPEASAPLGPDMVSVLAVSEDGRLWMVGPRRSEWVQLELTGRCNLKCPQCPNNSFSTAHNTDLVPGDLGLLGPVLDKVTHGCLDGFGELFMSRHVGDYLDAIHWSKNFLFHTNAQLLDEKRAALILDHAPPIRKMVVSLDTLDVEKYGRLRAGGTLEKALFNTRRFIEMREERGQACPKVGINLTYMKENAEELEDFVRMAAELDGYFELNFLYDATHLDESVQTGQDGWTFNYEEQKPKHFARQAVESIEKAMALAERLGVTIFVTGSLWKSMLTDKPDEYGYCGGRFPVEQCGCVDNTHMLLADGRVQYCVWQTSSMYNWRESGIVEPKDHPRGKAVREMIKKGLIPHECAGAGCSWVGLKPSDEGGKGEVEDGSTGKSGGWSGDKKTQG